jgi:hypothetical protein
MTPTEDSKVTKRINPNSWFYVLLMLADDGMQQIKQANMNVRFLHNIKELEKRKP